MQNKFLLFLLLGIFINKNSNAQCGAGARNASKDAFTLNGLNGIQDVSTSPDGQFTAFAGIASKVASYGNPNFTTTGGVLTSGNYVHILDNTYNYVSNTSVTRTFPALTNALGSSSLNAIWRIKYLPNGGIITMPINGTQLAYLPPNATNSSSWTISPSSTVLSIISSDPIQVVGTDTILCVTSGRNLVYYVGHLNQFFQFTTPVLMGSNGATTDAYCYVNGNVYYQYTTINAANKSYAVKKASFPGGTVSSAEFDYNAYSIGSSANRYLQALCVRPTDGLIFGIFTPVPNMHYESQDIYHNNGTLLYTSSHNVVNGDFTHIFVIDQNCVQATNQVDQRYLNLLFPLLNISYFRFDPAGNIYFNSNYNKSLSTAIVYPTLLVKLFPNGVMDQNFFINQTDYTNNWDTNFGFSGFSIYPNDGRIATTGVEYNSTIFDRPCNRTNGTDHRIIGGVIYPSSGNASSPNSSTDGSNLGNFNRGMMLFTSQGRMDCSGSAGTGCQNISIDCSTLTLTAAPTSGTAAAGLILSGTVNVTGAAGNFPIKVTGPGFTSAQNYVSINSLGSQTLNIPVNYDGTAFTSSNSITFTISSPTGAGSTTCSLPLTSPVNALVPTIKGATNCLPSQGPIMK